MLESYQCSNVAQTKRRSDRPGLSPKEQDLYFALVNRGKWVVDVQDVIEIEDVSHGYARKLLHDLNRKNALVRAARGTYTVATPESLHEPGEPPIDPFKILDQLMDTLERPYYAAYMTAAYLHGGAHEIPMNLDIATPNRRRPIYLGPTRISFRQIPEERMYGTTRIRQSGEYLTVSDLEKTLVDCADRLDLCGGPHGLARILWEVGTNVDPNKLGAYAREDGRKPMIQRLGYVLAQLAYRNRSRVPRDLYQALDSLQSDNVYPLDPSVGEVDEVNDDWNVRVNVDVLGWLDA